MLHGQFYCYTQFKKHVQLVILFKKKGGGGKKKKSTLGTTKVIIKEDTSNW